MCSSDLASSVDARSSRVEAVLLLRRREEAEREREEGVPVRPSDDEQTESLRVLVRHMVEDSCKEFHALGARTAEEGIIDDDGAAPCGVRQWPDCVVDDSCRQGQREPAPVCVAGIQETIGRILAERNRSRMNAALHVERAVLEDDADKLEKDQYGRESLELASVGRAQNLADVITLEEARRFL